MNKKIFLVFLIISSALLAGCNNKKSSDKINSKYIGKWTYSGAFFDYSPVFIDKNGELYLQNKIVDEVIKNTDDNYKVIVRIDMKSGYFMVSELDITFISEDMAIIKAITKEINPDKSVANETEGEAILTKE